MSGFSETDLWAHVLTIFPTGLYEICLYLYGWQTILPTGCWTVCAELYADGKLESQACITGRPNRQCKRIVTYIRVL